MYNNIEMLNWIVTKLFSFCSGDITALAHCYANFNFLEFFLTSISYVDRCCMDFLVAHI